MSAVVTESYSGGTLQSRDRVEYDYDDSGLRVRSSESSDADLDGSFETAGETTTYLVDHHNFTGFAQTITEITKDGTGAETKRVVYTFGHDEISQTTTGAGGTETLTFTHDGHGSVRVLFDAMAAAVQLFVYDAYGVMHAIYDGAGAFVSADTSAALTNLLFSGEKTDAATGLQYLRARYYNPNTGRFNRVDPFFGNHYDPQSFHKYLYAHADPIAWGDPTGMFIGGLISGVIGSWGQIKDAGVSLSIKYVKTASIHAMVGAFAGTVFQNLVGGFSRKNTGIGAYYGAILGLGIFIARSRGKTTEAVISGLVTGAINTAFGASRDLHELINQNVLPDWLSLGLSPGYSPLDPISTDSVTGFLGSTARAGVRIGRVALENFFQGFSIGVYNEATEFFTDGPIRNASVNFLDTYFNSVSSQWLSGQQVNQKDAIGLALIAATTDVFQAFFPDELEDHTRAIIAGAIAGVVAEYLETLSESFGLNVFDSQKRYAGKPLFS